MLAMSNLGLGRGDEASPLLEFSLAAPTFDDAALCPAAWMATATADINTTPAIRTKKLRMTLPPCNETDIVVGAAATSQLMECDAKTKRGNYFKETPAHGLSKRSFPDLFVSVAILSALQKFTSTRDKVGLVDIRFYL
jgi:hypothetical protein